MTLRARLRLTYINIARCVSTTVGREAAEHRAWLFNRMIEAKRIADKSESRADYDRAAEMYHLFMRAHLTDPELEIVRLEDELARATLELRQLKEQGS